MRPFCWDAIAVEFHMFADFVDVEVPVQARRVSVNKASGSAVRLWRSVLLVDRLEYIEDNDWP